MTGAIPKNQPGLGNDENSLKVLDILSGIGGMSLGLERAGMHTIGFCESGRIQQSVLQRHWPSIHIFPDATKTAVIVSGVGIRPDIIAGGDPCPIRSRVRSNGESRHPDLSGYFLALVEKLRPRWWSAKMFLHQTMLTLRPHWACSDTEQLLSEQTPLRLRARADRGISLSDAVKPPGCALPLKTKRMRHLIRPNQ